MVNFTLWNKQWFADSPLQWCWTFPVSPQTNMLIEIQHICAFLLTLSFYQLNAENLSGDVETHATYYQLHNAYKNSTVNNSVDIINITFAKDLNIDLYISTFYHLKHARLQSLSVPVELRQSHIFLVLLLISGDVPVNPSPSKFSCGNKKCHTTVAKNYRAVLCESCFYRWHITCADITPSEYHLLSNTEDPLLCKTCLTFQFSDSFFEDQPILYNGDSPVSSNETLTSVFDEIKTVRKNHINKFMVSHLNINSL